MKILVSGYLIRKPVAGLAYHYLQYVIGLKALGHDVFYIEDSEDVAGGLGPNLYHVDEVFDFLGLPPRWAYYDFATRQWIGSGAEKIRKFIRQSDILINISGSLATLDWFQHIPIRVFIDTDPVFTQAKTISYPAWASRCYAHTHFFTFGENFGRAGCDMPDDGIPWRPTRQPIVLDHWKSDIKPSNKFTTIMSWKSYDPVEANGSRYGVKEDSFSLVETLPKTCHSPLEIALDSPPETAENLETKGWSIVSAKSISETPDAYRSYIQNSAGEFAVAKSAYVSTNSGWFSERSACYLAAGRPVITQDTGFTQWMDNNQGARAFRTREEAETQLDQVLSNYEYECSNALEIANEFFDSTSVISKLLDAAMSTPAKVQVNGSASGKCLAYFNKVSSFIEEVIPKGDSYVLIDDRQFGTFGESSDRRVIPFLEFNGQYWGKPESSKTAIQELEKLKIKYDFTFIVITPESNWWLSYFEIFMDYLDSTCISRSSKNGATIFEVKE